MKTYSRRNERSWILIGASSQIINTSINIAHERTMEKEKTCQGGGKNRPMLKERQKKNIRAARATLFPVALTLTQVGYKLGTDS